MTITSRFATAVLASACVLFILTSSCVDCGSGSKARRSPFEFDLGLSFYLEREGASVGVLAVDPIGTAPEYRKDIDLARVQLIEGFLTTPLMGGLTAESVVEILRVVKSIRNRMSEGLMDSGGVVLGIEVLGRRVLVAVGLPHGQSSIIPGDVLPRAIARGVGDSVIVTDPWVYFDDNFLPNREQSLSLNVLLAIDAFLEAEGGGPRVEGFEAYAIFSGRLGNPDFKLAVEPLPVECDSFGVTTEGVLSEVGFAYRLTLEPLISLTQCLKLLDSIDQVVEQSDREGEFYALGLTLSLPGP